MKEAKPCENLSFNGEAGGNLLNIFFLENKTNLGDSSFVPSVTQHSLHPRFSSTLRFNCDKQHSSRLTSLCVLVAFWVIYF